MKKRYIYILIVSVLIAVILFLFVFFGIDRNYPINIDGIDIDKSPTRVIAMSNNIVDIMVENGYKEFLVGVPNYYNNDENLKNIPKVGTTQIPNVSLITEQKADLLITSIPFTQQYKLKIEQGGTIIINIKPSIKKDEFNAMAEKIFLLMEGKVKSKNKFKEYVEKQNSDLQKLYSEAKIKENQTFAIIPESSTVSTKDTIESGILSNIMGENVTGEVENFEFNIDDLKTKNPEYLIVRNGVDISKLQDLDAVKNNKVIYIDFIGFEENSFKDIEKDIKTILEKVYNVTDKTNEVS